VNGLLAGAEVPEEFGRVDRLGKQLEVVAEGTGAFEDFYRGGLATEEHDAGAGEVLADGDCGLYAIEVRHEDVGEDGFGSREAGGLDGVFAAISSVGQKTVAVQDLNNGVCDEHFVIDNEHSTLGGHIDVRVVASKGRIWRIRCAFDRREYLHRDGGVSYFKTYMTVGKIRKWRAGLTLEV
jgi:hypothetical protein